MSNLHLTEGSVQPNMVEGKLRLYSMEYCPFAQRARLVLNVKNIPHDIVNVNLMKKPSWLFNVHPEGKVPALDIGSKVIVESLDIVDYLDDKYPEPPLYPEEEGAKEKDKELIKKMGPMIGIFTDIILEKANKTPAEWLDEFTPHLQVFEDEFEERGTVFFGGDKPGMVDLMLWPWAERAGTVVLVLKDRLPLQANSFPCLRAWRRALRNEPCVDCIYHGPEKFYKVVLFKTAGHEPDYDSV